MPPSDNPESMIVPRLEEAEGTETANDRERGEIETDRDSFTPATTTAGTGLFIVESAYTFTENRAGVKDSHSLPEFLLRYGLVDRLELRLGWNWEVGTGSEGAGGDVFNEVGPEKKLQSETRISYGVKVLVTKNEKIIPGSALLLMAYTPTSGPSTETQFVGTYVFGWKLPYDCKLDAAIRYWMGAEEQDHFNEWAPSVVLKVPLTEKLKVHAEYFGLFTTNKAEDTNHQYFSPGIHYLVNSDLEMGVRVGWGLNEQTPRFFCNTGFGWRF
jgi:hypothetical protein